MQIVEANFDDLNELVRMGRLLWPDHSVEDLRQEFEEILGSDNQKAFLCKADDGKYVGFQTLSLRREYVEGATSSPVGYLEGIYVDKEYRKKGIGKGLVEVAQEWAQAHGCKELGSDTWDWNADSIKFHEKVGFTKVETLVHFIKEIK